MNKVFVNRRRQQNRRLDKDPCQSLTVDLYHRKRRKQAERRDYRKSLVDDYYAFVSDEDSNPVN